MTPDQMFFTGIALGLTGVSVLLIYLFISFLDWRARRWNERWRQEMR